MNADKKGAWVQPAAEQVELEVGVFRMLTGYNRVGGEWGVASLGGAIRGRGGRALGHGGVRGVGQSVGARARSVAGVDG